MRKIFCLVLVLLLLIPVPVFAQTLDDITSGNISTEQRADSDSAVADYFKGKEQISEENLVQAKEITSPVANFLGTLAGFVLMVTQAGILVVTALDLAYIGLPFTRETLTAKRQYVSDEALRVVPKNNSMQGGMMPQTGMSGPMSPQMGVPSPMPQQAKLTKNAIIEYFKHRIFFIVLFAISTVLLTSSLITASGINLAELLTKIIVKINNLV